MADQEFNIWLDSYQNNALQLKQRRLLVFAGECDWAIQLLQSVASFSNENSPSSSKNDKVWHFYSDNGHDLAALNSKNYRDFLGTESDYLVFLDSDINLDALAALSGTLVAGGVLFFIWPNEHKQSHHLTESAYFKRLRDKFFNTNNIDVIEQGQPLRLPLIESESEIVNGYINIDYEKIPLGCVTQEQYQAVQAILKVAKGHRNRPLVLTADRGRGKSSALAIACEQLLLTGQQKQQIIVSASHSQSLAVFFQQLIQCLPNAIIEKQRVRHENGIVEFIPIDQLIKEKPQASIVLIDEAAGVPVYLLTQLLKQYHRIVFSSTQHGYEGAGRGFTIKFTQVLDTYYPQWQLMHINEPIRWAIDDPLEQFIFDTCLLDAQLPVLPNNDDVTSTNDAIFGVHSSQELIDDERLLGQLFAVLVTAHYQTSPNDLKLMLANDNVSIVSLIVKGDILAVALLMSEGQCHDDEINFVKTNQKRLRDQFIPQSLLTHCGIDSAFKYRYCRVMRIAVHPKIHGKAIGSQFLFEIENYAKTLNFDFIGASFGINQALLNFWLQAEYQIARVGFKQDKSSGEYSALLLKNLSGNTEKLQAQISQAFYRTFDYLLTDEYQALNVKVIWQILHVMPREYLPKLTSVDQQCVEDFAERRRLYSACVYGLHQWLLRQMHKPFSNEILPLITRILQKESISQTCNMYGLSGKKALNEHLIRFVTDNDS